MICLTAFQFFSLHFLERFSHKFWQILYLCSTQQRYNIGHNLDQQKLIDTPCHRQGAGKICENVKKKKYTWCLRRFQDKKHTIQVSYLSEIVSTSRFGKCNRKNISLGSERENCIFVLFCHIHLAPPFLLTFPCFQPFLTFRNYF